MEDGRASSTSATLSRLPWGETEELRVELGMKGVAGAGAGGAAEVAVAGVGGNARAGQGRPGTCSSPR
jgi:hypothetical protein